MDGSDIHPTGVIRDFADLRDYPYTPTLASLPAEHMPWDSLLLPDGPVAAVRNQGDGGTCVGQALASLIDIQLRLRGARPAGRVSAAMLYRMARFHDLAAAGQDSGIGSLRSAIKGFFHHGVCLDDDAPGGWRDDDRDREWPSPAQADAAAECTLGAYSRVQPILHHYHCAIAQTGAVLVTAQTHQGWSRTDSAGAIIAKEPSGEWGLHAFVVLGYNRQGFLILNSWGRDWGGVEAPDGRRIPGLAIWSYADWARSVADGWVLRLGVPGQEAFAVAASEQGLGRTASAEARRAMPYRLLRGHFLNMDMGRWQGRGAYATPEPAVRATLSRIRDNLLKNPDCRGMVLALPGITAGERRSFKKAVRQRNGLAARGLDYLTCFWSADFAAEMQAVLEDIFARCRSRAGEATQALDTLFEETARGAGRAFWRDIERQAYCAARPCDPDAGLWQDDPACTGDRGKLGQVFQMLAQTCAGAGKPLHLLADGAGALVLDGLLQGARETAGGSDPLDWVPALGNMVLTFPAVPLDQAQHRILPLARAMAARTPGSARILVPAPDLEARLTAGGYNRSILHLVSRSFLERDPQGRLQPMLGTCGAAFPLAPETGDPPQITPAEDCPESPFQLFRSSRLFRMEQGELDADPRLEALVVDSLAAAIPPFRSRPSPEQEPVMDTAYSPRISLAELHAQISQGTLKHEQLTPYFIEDEARSGPFSPVMLVNREMVEMPPLPRSALALNTGNGAARLARLANYYARLAQGYVGPRIAAEGDSWCQYPLLLADLIDYIDDYYPVYDTSAAGDLLENMARQREYIAALRESGAEILLLSAGGNDVCAGGKLAQHLEAHAPGMKPGDYLRRSYQAILDNAITWYERICRDVNAHFPGVTVIVHGYDYVIPNNGRWLGKPMASRGITDRKLQRAIAAEMIDQFNRALRRMAQTMGHVAYVDCRNCVPADRWHDELHPDNGGFAKVAGRILTKIKEITARRDARDRSVGDVLSGGAGGAAPRATPRKRQQVAQALAGPQNLARSLHIGLNAIDPIHYAGDSGILYGCENDARAMRDLAEAQGYSARMLLTKDATREAVIDELRRAARDLKAGDQFLFTNACHGAQVKDLNNDEVDPRSLAQDSTLCLFNAQLIDDELWNIFYEFQPGVRIVMIADSCHSGTVSRAAPGQAVLGLRPRCLNAGLAARVLDENRDFYERVARATTHVDRSQLTSAARTQLRASLIQFSACRDDQTASDGAENGLFTGALLRVWDKGGFAGSYDSLERRLQEELATTSQTPGLFRPEPKDPAFARQRPFSVLGAELNMETGGIRLPPPALAKDDPASDAPRGAMQLGDEGEDAPDAHTGSPVVDDATLADFRDFMAGAGLSHLDPGAFLTLGAGHAGSGAGQGLNTAPPQSLWPNILATARVIGALQERLGAPASIISAYRSPAYGEALGSDPESWHGQFRACDIVVADHTPDEVADTLHALRDEGLFQGGIGRHADFTHLDTRGMNRDWSRIESPVVVAGGHEIAVERLRRIAETLPMPRAERQAVPQGELDQATAAVNGPQLMALAQALTPEQRRAVLYSTQFAQRAADAAADPLRDRANWWATHNAALAAVGWVINGSTTREATASDLKVTLDALILEVMEGVVGVDKLKALRAVLKGLKGLASKDNPLVLLDQQARRAEGGAIQVGAAEVDGGGIAITTGAVQFRSTDNRQQVLFLKWGGATQSVWLAAGRLVLNEDFYRDIARPIVEERMADAAARIRAFSLTAPAAAPA